MTEVPEHLLKRSRDRRASLGLGGGGDAGGGDTPPAASDAGDAEPSTAVAPAAATAAARPAAATPAEPAAPEPLAPYVEAAVRRKKIPIWAMPVLAFLPVWAIIWVGGLSPAATGEASPLDLGAEVYTRSCASCHGGGGGGGVGRPLDAGEVLLTFPDIAGQLEFVALGSQAYETGAPYGDPNRPGGAHTVGSFGVMPGFADSLTAEELLAVVRYEREVLSGEEIPADRIDADDQLLWPTGEPIVEEGGTNLIAPTGDLLFGDDGFLTVPQNFAAAG